MKADDLLSGRFDAWFAPARPVPLWFFVHVPKTAGSSLTADLAPIVAPYRSIHIDHADRSKPGPVRFDEATEAFVTAQAILPARFASGHVQYRNVERILQAVPGTRLFTTLREPVARLVSDFLYQRSPMHPLAEEVKRRIPDIDAFVELKGQRNRMARHLLPPRFAKSGDVAGAVRFLRMRYAFVGIQERYELGVRALSTRLGKQRLPSARMRVNEGAAEERAQALARVADPALRRRIEELSGLDIAIYAEIAGAWERIAAPLAARLDEMAGRAAA